MLLLDPHLFRTMLTVMLPLGFTVMAPCGDRGDPALCVSSTLRPPSSGALQPPAAPNANHPATFTCINTPSSHEVSSEAGPRVLPETQEATPPLCVRPLTTGPTQAKKTHSFSSKPVPDAPEHKEPEHRLSQQVGTQVK